MRNSKPTRVQVKQSVIDSNNSKRQQQLQQQQINRERNIENFLKQQQRDQEEAIRAQFKPLVEVDPTIKLTKQRPQTAPFRNPNPGDYILSKTPSTEGIASKKSLELKKRYLLGEQGAGGGILKSGSTSALDSKFKSFHSNISECQKMLGNPVTIVSPSPPPPTSVSPKLTSIEDYLATKKELDKQNSNEKENVYGLENINLLKKNELNLAKISNANGTNNNNLDYSETINTVFVDNKIKEMRTPPKTPTMEQKDNSFRETIDLITPEKDQTIIDLVTPEKNQSIIDLDKIALPEEVIETNKKFIENLSKTDEMPQTPIENKQIQNLKGMFLDLTNDQSPALDRSLMETNVNFSFSTPNAKVFPDIISNIVESEHDNAVNKNKNNIVKSEAPEQEEERSRSPAHETSITVPSIPWNNAKKLNQSDEIESDSLSSTSSSSTSSVDDIPHFVLDSTTSPETQNGFVPPRLEVRDTTGELMQIDSLMIIDGNYIGDPEDLKLLEKLPEGIRVPPATPAITPVTEESATLTFTSTTTASPSTKTNTAPIATTSAAALASAIATTTTTTTSSIISSSTSPTPLPTTVSPLTATATGKIDNVNDKKICDNSDNNNRKQYTSNLISTKTINKNLKFDTKNENKIDTLKNMPFTTNSKAIVNNNITINNNILKKPNVLDLSKIQNSDCDLILNDEDKTPMIAQQPEIILNNCSSSSTSVNNNSEKLPVALATTAKAAPPTAATTTEEDTISEDSETEMTGQVFTETELSDWAADDAVSENFVDIEFVLNSNKGTIRRNNKKSKKRAQLKGVKDTKNGLENKPKMMLPLTTQTPHQNLQSAGKGSPNECGILKNLDIENIEFMDTGSENDNSCAEAYSTVNKAMLKNCGYVEFVETNGLYSNKNCYSKNYRQGNDCNDDMNVKNILVNNNHKNSIESNNSNKIVEAINSKVHYIEQGACILNNDVDLLKTPVNEEPAFNFKLIDSHSPSQQRQQPDQIPMFLPTVASSQPQQQLDSLNDIEDDSLIVTHTTTDCSDLLTIVTSPNAGGETTTTAPSSTPPAPSLPKEYEAPSRPEREHKIAQKQVEKVAEDGSSYSKRRDDIMNYEKIKKLQMKIAQISNSVDLSSSNPSISAVNEDNIKSGVGSAVANNVPSSRVYNAEQQTSRKIEEITKERVKQKDIIHDLVMDKLHTKKQLNAEKRLNRSRNRNNVFNTSASPISPSTPMSGKSATNDTPTNGVRSIPTSSPCTNYPHYHYPNSSQPYQSHAMKPVEPKGRAIPVEASVERRHSIHTSPTNVKSVVATPVVRKEVARKPRERPMSDNLDDLGIVNNMVYEAPKLMKTQSFSVYNSNAFVTPQKPPRQNEMLSMTEKMRVEARARARLKSNQDLGLSPEDNLKLLRQKYQLNMDEYHLGNRNKSDDMKFREAKIMTSKSVNDIANVQRYNLCSTDDLVHRSHAKSAKDKLNDSISDSNLNKNNRLDEDKEGKGRGSASKDPERRKSGIIQTVSNFFNKKKDSSSTSSSTLNKPEKSDSMFGIFRISPKLSTKEKAKTKEFDRSKSDNCLKNEGDISPTMNKSNLVDDEDDGAPPIPPLPLHYQRSDDESYPANESKNELKKLRALSKASRQAELKRLRIAQEIQLEQGEIEVKIRDLEKRGVEIEKLLRGEGQSLESSMEPGASAIGANDDVLLREWLEIMRTITQHKKRDEELGIRQNELQLEHRHAQLKEELNLRLSCSKLDKSSSDVAAEGAILNEMLEIVAKRAALRPSDISSPSHSNDSDI